jgi:hypothetical protein
MSARIAWERRNGVLILADAEAEFRATVSKGVGDRGKPLYRIDVETYGRPLSAPRYASRQAAARAHVEATYYAVTGRVLA